MWSFEVCVVVALVSIYLTHWIYKWRNPKCNGILPPGSSGIPLVGETLQLFTPTYSNDVLPFIKKRLQRHGPLFRTNLAGRNIIVSADYEFNRFIFGQEEKLVVRWYLDSLSGLIKHGEQRPDGLTTHKYMKNLVASHFGTDSIRQKLLSQFEDKVLKALHSWSFQDSIELEYASIRLHGEFALSQLCSYDPEISKELIDNFVDSLSTAFLFPLKIPGTKYYDGLKKKEKVSEKIKEMVNDRLGSPQNAVDDDLLGQMIKDMSNVNFVTKEYINKLMFVLMFATFQTVPFVTTLALKFMSENPAVLQELTEEHEEILRKRETLDSSVTWEEFKSMTYTQQVINEALRLGSTFPGFLRRVVKDIKVKGYTIPAGWVIMTCHTAMHFDPEIYKDPLKFDPSRWKDVGPEFVSKNLKPFGGGIKQCVGADFSRASMAIFLHVLVTKYRWTVVKGGEIVQNPIKRFKNGFHINLRERVD